MPTDKAVHVILDNYAAHKKDKGRAWPARHPRWTFHFTPTSCSWLNAVEGFFAKLTRRRLKCGVFQSVVDLQAAINRLVREYNAANPKPFIWKAEMRLGQKNGIVRQWARTGSLSEITCLSGAVRCPERRTTYGKARITD